MHGGIWRTQEEIDAQLKRAKASEGSSDYAYGVLSALAWVTGDTDEPPMAAERLCGDWPAPCNHDPAHL